MRRRKGSLRTADVFLVIASLPPRDHRKYVSCSQASEKEALSESSQAFEVREARRSGLVVLYPECVHSFTDKPMVISEPSAPSTWLLGLAHVRQRSYSIHAVILEYAKIEQVKERLLAGWLSNKLRYNFMILFRRTVNSL